MGQAVATAPWSKADPRIQAWALANRQALEVFERGAEQPDAGRLAGDRSAGLNPNTLNTLALLEGSRRQESGDTASVGAKGAHDRAYFRQIGKRWFLENRKTEAKEK